MKKHVLCVGDSNTHGYMPMGGRYDEETRWPMRMQKILGDEWLVTEEGLSGRTIAYDDPVEGGFKSAMAFMPYALISHSPVDLVVIMLGTNDLKERFGLNPKTVGDSMMSLVRLVRMYGHNAEGKPPAILIVSPPLIRDNLMKAGHGMSFGERAIAMSHDLSREFSRVAKLMRCAFLNAAEYAEASPFDAVHMTREAHLNLGEAIAKKAQEIIK